MGSRPTPRTVVADPGWRYAVVAGIAALPLTLHASLSSGDSIGLGGPFVAGIVVGVLYRTATVHRARVAARAAVIAAAPLLVVLADLLWFVAVETSTPAGTKFHVGFYVVGFVVLGYVLSIVAAIVGARTTGWACRQFGFERPTEAGH